MCVYNTTWTTSTLVITPVHSTWTTSTLVKMFSIYVAMCHTYPITMLVCYQSTYMSIFYKLQYSFSSVLQRVMSITSTINYASPCPFSPQALPINPNNWIELRFISGLFLEILWRSSIEDNHFTMLHTTAHPWTSLPPMQPSPYKLHTFLYFHSLSFLNRHHVHTLNAIIVSK